MNCKTYNFNTVYTHLTNYGLVTVIFVKAADLSTTKNIFQYFEYGR